MRLEEIIPREPKKRKEYDLARQCLEEAKETKRPFIHILLYRGYIDAPSEFVYIWYNGISAYIRADDGPILFAFPLAVVSEFGDCDGSDPRAIWRSEVVKVKP